MKSLSGVFFLLLGILVFDLFSSIVVIEAQQMGRILAGPTGPSNDAKKFCVPKDGVPDNQLQKNLDWACGKGIDCSAIQPGMICAEPITVKSRATFAMNSYYRAKGNIDSACDFNGTAQITATDPSYGNCKYDVNKFCVPKDGVDDIQLQKNLDWACGQGIDCTPIQPGAACAEPATVKSRATFAMNSYYRAKGGIDSACDFSGTAQTTTTDPRNCKYN